jgi:RimJ/RimL family protein N-acetyltransferase
MPDRSASWLDGRLRGAGGAEWLVLRGESMAPLLRDGDRLRVEPLSGRTPAPGEVVVARRGERLVAHRLVEVIGGEVVTRGDACRESDPPLPAGELLGRVVAVERRGRAIALPEAPAESGAGPGLLGESEVVARHRAGTLPERFSMVLGGRPLPPLLEAGARVTVVRGAPPPGSVACVARGEGLLWRRVLAARAGAVRLRADIAPVDDGWSEAAIGWIERDGALDRVAARWPGAWTRLGWIGAWAFARVRNLPRQAAARLARRGRFSTAVAERQDGAVEVGLLDEAGRRVGETRLTVEGAEAWSFATRIEAAARGRGGAKVLLSAAVAAARRRGARRVRAHIDARNFASLAAYRRAGFRDTGRWFGEEGPPFTVSERPLREVALSLP